MRVMTYTPRPAHGLTSHRPGSSRSVPSVCCAPNVCRTPSRCARRRRSLRSQFEPPGALWEVQFVHFETHTHICANSCGSRAFARRVVPTVVALHCVHRLQIAMAHRTATASAPQPARASRCSLGIEFVRLDTHTHICANSCESRALARTLVPTVVALRCTGRCSTG